MSVKLTAQESIVTGLREERKLWGQELALQGASLAQDRGRMEAQIEALNKTVENLQDQLKVSSIYLSFCLSIHPSLLHL